LAANKRKILANAQKYLQKGQLDKALKEYQTLVELDPRDANSRLKLGDVHLRRNDRDAAIEAYKKVAVQFTKDGFDAKAVALYKQIAKIDDKRWEIYEPLAELYERLGLTAEALAALQTAADAYRREGRRREALELLRKMASLDPTNTTSRLKIADLLVQAEMPDDALAEYEAVAEELERQGAQEQLPGVYERMLELAPERTGPLAALARALVAQGQQERAEPFARRLVEADPDSVEGHELLAEILRGQGREDAAEASYRRLAELYRMRGDEESAREIAQRFLSGEDLSAVGGELEGDPEDSLIGGLGGPGEPIAPRAEAGSDSESASGPGAGSEVQEPEAAGDPEQLLAEARVYLRYRKLERAAATLESLLGREPDHLEALECLGEVRAEAGDREGATQVWLRAVETARRVGDLQAARELGERAASLDPSAVPGPQAAAEGAGDGFDLAAGEDADPDPGPATLDEVDLEIEIGDERIEEDEDLREDEDAAGRFEAAEGVSSPAPEASSLEPDANPGDSFGGGDDELDLDVDISLSGFDEPPLEEAETGRRSGPAESDGGLELEGLEPERGRSEETAVEGDADALDAASFGAGSSESAEARKGGSSTTPQQIAEDLEEADFYVQQGMLDEAESVLRRILAAAPNHPQAQLRLGEIIERRGGDPGSSGVRGVDPSAGAPAQAPETSDERSDETREDLGADLVSWDGGDDDPHPEEARAAGHDSAAEVGGVEPEIDVDLDLDVDFEASDADGASDASAHAAREPAEPAFAPGDDAEDASESERPAGADLSAGLSETQPELPEEAELDEAETRDETSDETSDETPDETRPPPAPAEPSPGPGPAPFAGGEAEEATFDLAAELSDVFEEDENGDSLSGVSDHGFEAVFREFKKGVREQLSESDYEAHYDLGIAYREMGLCEDALGEFRIALASPERKLSCLHMLGLCALDLGRPEDATSHLEQALALPDIPEPERAALRFDLGRAFEARGDRTRARAAYEAVAAVDPEYQDVASRLEALISGAGASAESGSEPDGDEPVETFESFDDLIAEAEAIMGEDEDEGGAAEPGDSGPRSDERRGEVPPAGAEDDTQPDPSPPTRKKRKISFL